MGKDQVYNKAEWTEKAKGIIEKKGTANMDKMELLEDGCVTIDGTLVVGDSEIPMNAKWYFKDGRFFKSEHVNPANLDKVASAST